MSKILSQDEIDALCRRPRAANPRPRVGDGGLGGVITYNFRRPDRISKDQIRSLHFLHDRFARNAASSLAAYLRAMTELSIVPVEQFAYSEFLMSLADPTAHYAIAMPPLDGLGALELNPTMAFTIVDRMLGGPALARRRTARSPRSSRTSSTPWSAWCSGTSPRHGRRCSSWSSESMGVKRGHRCAAGGGSQRGRHPAGVRPESRRHPRHAQPLHSLPASLKPRGPASCRAGSERTAFPPRPSVSGSEHLISAACR